ncbi:MAG: GntR family transcriptional regulator [Clostridiales Family XIII bacterium]|jgi:DNA-binding transcriptional regulator YhcF (GntR family)|nr:GntR family transcriptional regulator [Clostridiales Family XIII bacterium]
MKWIFDNDRPIYVQLTYLIKLGIVSGAFPAGSAMPSVRTLATEAGVNPNTMQKALSDLEGIGLLHTQRTAGRYVTEDTGAIEQTKQTLAQKHIDVFFEGMNSLGMDGKTAITLAEKSLNNSSREVM